MNDTQAAETPLADHVARFWKHLETETVRIVLDLKRTVGHDAPDGPTTYWDSATFSDEVAKALVAERAAAPKYGPSTSKRPVAFRVRDADGRWVLWDDEEACSRYAVSVGHDYQGLYVRDGK
jgi:hypothetical protein